ncbi:hypothetical protein [Mucisphaera sp.]|uniref:hypothetical protein n=1 Tax=Mucisphaera sp. TaxID=2913024 RepID=UPI003D0C9FEA
MSPAAVEPLLPWQDRWNIPEAEQLLQPYNELSGQLATNIMDGVLELGPVERTIVWHGDSWFWTFQFDLLGDEIQQGLCYLVPNPEAFMVAVPLHRDVIAQLPMRRLNRYIRDVLRSSKCAVDLHWAMWRPSLKSEGEHLLDLIKRKKKILLEASA